MRNLLALFGAALLTVVGAGWYLGWYKVRSQPASVPGETNVHININTKKITSDLQQGVQEGEQKLQQFLEKKTVEEAKSTANGLTLPSPLGPQSKSGDKASTPLFQFHSGDKGTPQDHSGINHPLIQLGNK
jgi:hypothetical protein